MHFPSFLLNRRPFPSLTIHTTAYQLSHKEKNNYLSLVRLCALAALDQEKRLSSVVQPMICACLDILYVPLVPLLDWGRRR